MNLNGTTLAMLQKACISNRNFSFLSWWTFVVIVATVLISSNQHLTITVKRRFGRGCLVADRCDGRCSFSGGYVHRPIRFPVALRMRSIVLALPAIFDRPRSAKAGIPNCFCWRFRLMFICLAVSYFHTGKPRTIIGAKRFHF